MIHGEMADTYEPLLAGCRLTTPFEDWCESSGVHPEAPLAWERFQATLDPRAATVGEV